VELIRTATETVTFGLPGGLAAHGSAGRAGGSEGQ
jgi:hypothetical protein